MSLSFHIGFNGRCKEFFEFYAEYLNGTIGSMLEFKDSPVAANVSKEWQHKIVHANISIEGVELTGADVKPKQHQKPVGFNILLGVNNENAVKSLLEQFSVGGEVILSPQKTFFPLLRNRCRPFRCALEVQLRHITNSCGENDAD